MRSKVCRVCGRIYRYGDGLEWLQAVPDGLSDQALREAIQWWCSRECRDSDPRYRPLPSGEALLQVINRMKAGAGPVPGDIGDFFARGSGQGREAIVAIADKILAELQEPVEKHRQLGLRED